MPLADNARCARVARRCFRGEVGEIHRFREPRLETSRDELRDLRGGLLERSSGRPDDENPLWQREDCELRHDVVERCSGGVEVVDEQHYRRSCRERGEPSCTTLQGQCVAEAFLETFTRISDWAITRNAPASRGPSGKSRG